MSCYYPVQGYRSATVNKATGKRAIVFSPLKGFSDLPMQVPCGRCIGCMQDRAKEWAVRCVQEASLYKENCFLTLTYSEENLPEGGSLRPRDFVLFMKRLRKSLNGVKIRFFQCGEYGERLSRPHHHCIIFGWRPPDVTLWSRTGKGVRLYHSKIVEKAWNKGWVSVGDVTYESANYVARYILKKVRGPGSESHYQGKVPEYITMSRKPGIGRLWIEKYHNDVYQTDNLHYGLGKITKAPRYYDKVYATIDPDRLDSILSERRKEEANSDYNSPYRLMVREKLQLAREKYKERQYETGG